MVWSGDACCGRCGTASGGGGRPAVRGLRRRRPAPAHDRDLLQVYFASAALAYANANLSREIIESQKEMIQTLSELVETRSLETANHVLRVGEMAQRCWPGCAGLDDETAADACAWPRPCTTWARWASPTACSTSRAA